MLVQPILNDLIGPNAAPVSLSIEYGVAVAAGDPVQIEARIVRATRTLVFAQAQLLSADGVLAADFSAVFRRLIAQESGPDRMG